MVAGLTRETRNLEKRAIGRVLHSADNHYKGPKRRSRRHDVRIMNVLRDFTRMNFAMQVMYTT